jgi:hypothetical protein
MIFYLRGTPPVLLLFFLILFFSPTFAEELTVKIKADSLRYSEDRGSVYAAGSVEARLRDFVMRSDSMVVDTNTNIVTAEGNVSLTAQGYSAHGDRMVYDTSGEVASISNFNSVFTSPDIKGEVHLKIGEFYDGPQSKWGLEGDATTCDYPFPHYELKAKRFDYYPDDKIVGFSVTFYINGAPVMWFPYWIYSFKRGRSSIMPVIGHNNVEGDFAKFGFDYFANNDAYGVVYVDIMQKKGLGKGIEHDYRIDPKNEGVLYLYHLEERDTNLTDWVAKIDHRYMIDDSTKLGLFSKYADIYTVPFGRLDQNYSRIELNHASDRKYDVRLDVLDDRWNNFENYNLSAGHSWEKYRTGFLSTFSRSKLAPNWERYNTRLTHEQLFLKDNITFSSTVNFISNATDEGVPHDDRLEPQVEWVDREEMFTLKLFQNWYIDTDRDTYLLDKNTEYLERQPEATVSFKTYDAGLFNINTSAGVGRFHETKWIPVTSTLRNFTSDRYNANISAYRSLSVGMGTSLGLLGAVEQYIYTPGDERYVLKEEADLRTELGGFFRNSASYRRGYSEGDTPFFFDTVGVDHEYMNDTVDLYYLDRINWETSCGYNYRTKLYNDLTTTLRVRPDPRLEGSAATGYDINNKIYRDLALRATVRPWDKFSWSWESTHDLNNDLFKSASSYLDAEFFDDWRYKFHIQVRHTYDYFLGKFIMRDLTIVKDLHCWEMSYAYSDWLKQWTLTFTLKAFPGQPVGWGAGDRGYFWNGPSPESYLDSYDQPSPARY